MVGEYGTILAATDGGATWSAQNADGPHGGPDWLNSVTFTDASHGWAVGHGGVIVATADGGDTWNSQDPGGDGSFE